MMSYGLQESFPSLPRIQVSGRPRRSASRVAGVRLRSTMDSARLNSVDLVMIPSCSRRKKSSWFFSCVSRYSNDCLARAAWSSLPTASGSGLWKLSAWGRAGDFEFFGGHVYGDVVEQWSTEVAFAGVGEHGEDG